MRHALLRHVLLRCVLRLRHVLLLRRRWLLRGLCHWHLMRRSVWALRILLWNLLRHPHTGP